MLFKHGIACAEKNNLYFFRFIIHRRGTPENFIQFGSKSKKLWLKQKSTEILDPKRHMDPFGIHRKQIPRPNLQFPSSASVPQCLPLCYNTGSASVPLGGGTEAL